MPKRVDANQKQIVKLFRFLGATVQDISSVGTGCPDCIVGYRGRNYLVEIKDGGKPPSRRKLTPDEEKWHATWAGQKCIVKTEQEAIDLIQKGQL